MSPATPTLPAGWSRILDEVHQRLDHAISLADARLAQLPHVELHSFADQRRQEVAQWSERLDRLSAYLESAEQVVQSVDEVLQNEEAILRQQLATSRTLRQKLAGQPS